MKTAKLLISSAAIYTMIASSCAVASPVTLTSKDGKTSLKGELLDFDGQFYKLDSGLGVASIPAADVNCDGDSCPDLMIPASIGVFGNDRSASRALPQLLKAYGKSFGGATDDASLSAGAGSNFDPATREIADLISGEAEVILSSRQIFDDEAKQLLPGGLTDVQHKGLEYVLASEGMVVAVDPSLQIDSISLEDLGRVYSGEIRNWYELGGPDMPITVFMREFGSASRHAFNDLVLKPQGMQMSDRVIGVDNDTGVAASIVAFPGAMGITGLAAAGTTKTLAIRDTCGLQSVATPFAVQTGQYPLTRHLYAYRSPSADPSFIDGMVRFLQSDDGRSALDEVGLIGHGILEDDPKSQGVRMMNAMAAVSNERSQQTVRSMVDSLADAVRLSPTFRPDATGGYNALEYSSLKNLSKAITEGRYDGYEVLFVGFTDGESGDFQGNQLLARSQAKRVHQSLIKLDPGLRNNRTVTFRALGYGGISPLACSDTETGRRVNRRVEVWTRKLAAN